MMLEEDESSSDILLSKLATIKPKESPEDEESNSSDVPLSKFTSKQKEILEDDSSSDAPLSKLVPKEKNAKRAATPKSGKKVPTEKKNSSKKAQNVSPIKKTKKQEKPKPGNNQVIIH